MWTDAKVSLWGGEGEEYMTGDDNAEYSQWCKTSRQTFVPTETFDVEEVSLKLYRDGYPGTSATARICTMDSTVVSLGRFNANALTTDIQGEWITVSMPAYKLLAGTEYYLEIDMQWDTQQTSRYEKIYWRYDSTDSSYAGGEAWRYSCSASWWSPIGGDFMFAVKAKGEDVVGASYLLRGDLESPAGAYVLNLVVSDEGQVVLEF